VNRNAAFIAHQHLGHERAMKPDYEGLR